MSVYWGIFSFISGLGLFLYGMQQLEDALKVLSSESFKSFLRKSTANPLTSLIGGTITTMVVQSSSMVGLMMMAFVGAGVMPLSNAVGVVLGANLGTTFTGWIVATLGFKLPLAAMAVPAMGVGALITVVFNDRDKLKAWALLLLGLGLLLFGLDIMKTSMETLAERFDMAVLQGYPAVVYLLVGILFTAIIQSSSAAMMITLSALHAGIVDLPSAAALVVGADLGTTSTMILGGIGGSAIKKQLALAHVVINVFTAILAFSLLPWLLILVEKGFGLTDPLLGLVAFHSSFNFIGIMLILPFTGVLSRFLARRFLASDTDIRTYINSVPTTMVPEALVAVRKEVECLLVRVCALTLRNLKLDASSLKLNDELTNRLRGSLEKDKPYLESYGEIKQLEGEILEFSGLVQTGEITAEQVKILHGYLSAARHGVYAAKSLKDIRENLVMLRHSEKQVLRTFYEQQVALHRSSLAVILLLIFGEHEASYLREEISTQKARNHESHAEIEKALFVMGLHQGADELETSTLLNVNREFRASIHNFLLALNYLRQETISKSGAVLV